MVLLVLLVVLMVSVMIVVMKVLVVECPTGHNPIRLVLTGVLSMK